MTRARPALKFEPVDPLADVIFRDTQGLAGDLAEILEAVRPFDVDSIKAILHKKNIASGKLEWLDSRPQPIDIDAIARWLKEEHGGGEYRITIMAGNKPRRIIELPIQGPPKSSRPAAADTSAMGGDFMKLFLAQQDAADRRREDAENRRAEERRETNDLIKTALVAAIPALVPILLGSNREKLSDVIAMMNANKPEGNNLKETLEMVALVKGLFEKDSPDFDANDVVGSIGRMIGPGLGAIGRMGRQQHQALEAPPEQVALPPPAPTFTPPPAGFVGPPDPHAGQVVAPRLVTLIGPHAVYFSSAHLPADLAAEAIVSIMVREGVTEEEVLALVAPFTLSPDWQADLAAYGFDLRGNPDWADDLLDALQDEWSNRDRQGHGGAGGAGSMADARHDAEPGASGQPLNGGQGPSRPAH